MPKKQKSKSNSNSARGKKDAFSPSPKPEIEDPICACMELDIKSSSRAKGRSSTVTDDVNVNSIDDKYAVIHWSDAYKMDIHDGEPALIVRTIPSSPSELKSGNNDSDSITSAICKVRISPAAPSSSSGTPLAPKKKSSPEAATYGSVLLSPDSLYEYFATIAANTTESKTVISPVPIPMATSTPPVSSATKNASYTSPSKAKFSFSKGGGGESLISPSPNKYTSPSGSKFSFSKGGGGGGGSSFVSPGVGQTTRTPISQSKKHSSAKVHVIPLINLSPQHLRRLCPDVYKLVIYPMNNNDSSKQSSIDSYSSSIRLLQTLITSKYRGYYVEPKSAIQPKKSDQATTSSGSLESIAVSFRGKTENFRIVDAQTDPMNDERELSSSFERLSISDNAIDGQAKNGSATENESQLRKLIESHLSRQSKTNNGSSTSENVIAYKITPRTRIEFTSSLDGVQSTTPQSTLDTPHHANQSQQDVCAGLDSTLSRIKDALLPPLLHPNLFPSDGPLRPPKGALLYGPAGVGKSLLASQIANDVRFAPSQKNVHVRLIQCADIMSSTAIVGEAEKVLSDIFEEAERKATGCGGSLVIMDDVHLICPRRGGMGGGAGVDQLAGTLLALLDGIGSSQNTAECKNSGGSSLDNNKSGGGLVVLAITSDPSLLDPALRRPGRLDVEIEVPVPDDEARAEILGFHLSQLMTMQQIDKDGIKALSRLAKGFTGADCKLAVKEAVRTAISRSLSRNSQIEQATDITEPNGTSLAVEYADLEHAIRITKPSAIKSVAVEVPKVAWSSIGGMDHVKALLKESIELPLTHPHLFEMMQVPPPKGILLYGPPGCSKTLMARAIATEGSMNFLAVKGPELLSKWLGESERALASLFRRARLAAPAVIFFDEMDAIASKRGDGGGSGGDRLLSQLLTELDGVTSGGNVEGKGGRVVVVGATNRPDILDAALTRPGRMDRMIYVGLPDEPGRKSIFDIGLSGKDCHEDVDTSALAIDEVSKGYSGAEIIALCRDAALHAIGEMDDGYIARPKIHKRHLLQSIKEMKPRTTTEMLQFYDSFRGRH